MYFQALHTVRMKAISTAMTELEIIQEVKATLLTDNPWHGIMPSDEKLKEIIKSTRRRNQIEAPCEQNLL